MKLFEKIKEKAINIAIYGTKRDTLLYRLKGLFFNLSVIMIILMIPNIIEPNIINIILLILGLLWFIFLTYVYKLAIDSKQKDFLLSPEMSQNDNAIYLFRSLENACENIKDFDLDQRAELNNKMLFAINDAIYAKKDK